MQIGVNLPLGQGHKRWTSRVRRSKVKVTGGRSKIWRREGNIVLDSLGGVDFLVLSQYLLYTVSFLSASHYVSKRGAY